MTPRWHLTPLLLRSHVWPTQVEVSLYPSPMHIHQSMWMQWPFFKKKKKNFNKKKRSMTQTIPRWPLTPHPLRSHVWLYPRITVSNPHKNMSKHVDTVTFFFKKFNQRSMTLRWPLTPLLFRSHVWHYPRIIVSKSHGNTSMNADRVINFAKHTTYYIHTSYILRTTYRMSDHIVSF